MMDALGNRVHFPSDGEIVYMHPDAKDVFLTWELINVACNVGWVNKVHYVYKELLLWSYITMLSFIMIELCSISLMYYIWFFLVDCTLIYFLYEEPWLIEFIFNSLTIYTLTSLCWSLKNLNEIHSQICDECTGIYLWGKGRNSFPM